MQRFVLSVVIVIGVTACSNLTRVAAPDLTQPSDLNNPAGALARRAGALSHFYSEFGGWADQSGTLTDEFTAPYPGGSTIDRRVLPDGGGSSTSAAFLGPVTRANALAAISLLQQYSAKPSSYIGELFAVLGTMETIMGENMCAGVPLGTVTSGIPVAGQPLTQDGLFQHALLEFDSAAKYTEGDSVRLSNWIGVGKARLLLDLDSLSAALQSAHSVPTSYRETAIYSSSIFNQVNAVASDLAFQSLTVSDREGINGLNFGTAADARVPIESLGIGSDGVTPIFVFTPYDSMDSPIPIATGVEARLIEAEVQMRSGNAGEWSGLLNSLRADSTDTGISGMPALSADSTITAAVALRVAVMFRERAFWLFGSGHRLGDLRRLIRQYGMTQDQTFPSGTYKSGEPYGSAVNFPITGDNANPSVPECTNRGA